MRREKSNFARSYRIWNVYCLISINYIDSSQIGIMIKSNSRLNNIERNAAKCFNIGVKIQCRWEREREIEWDVTRFDHNDYHSGVIVALSLSLSTEQHHNNSCLSWKLGHFSHLCFVIAVVIHGRLCAIFFCHSNNMVVAIR